MSSVAIVILNFNGQSFLERFLPSVLTHSVAAGSVSDVAVYVADNASTDGSVAFLQQQMPTVRLIQLPHNAGYAGGYNAALDIVRSQYGGATYYVLLNSDVAVTSGWLDPVISLMESRPNVAACQPKIRAFTDQTLFEYAGAAGGYIDWLGYPFCRGRLFDTLEPDTGQYDDDRPVFWATGACLFVRAEVFHQSGGFDASFFAHMEEIDWCWRVQRMGHEVWTSGQSVVYHVGGGTLAKTNPRKTYLNYRNSLMMLYKNLPDGMVFSTIFLRLVLDGISSAKFLAAGQWRDIWAIIRAHFGFYGALSTLRTKRQQLKPLRNDQLPIYPKSIIWQYFVKGKRTYQALPE